MNARGWFLMLLPLPLVLGVGFINDNVVNRPLRVAPQQVYEAIRTGRTYEGDLFALSLEKGVNYNAIKGVRELMGEKVSLSIGGSDGMSDTVFVVADFDNGAWITCRVVADQLSFCYDAKQPYLKGLAAVIATGQVPEDCPYCRFSASDELRAWLQDQAAALGGGAAGAEAGAVGQLRAGGGRAGRRRLCHRVPLSQVRSRYFGELPHCPIQVNTTS